MTLPAAGLLGLQGSRCPAGVTVAPGLEAREAAGARQVRSASAALGGMLEGVPSLPGFLPLRAFPLGPSGSQTGHVRLGEAAVREPELADRLAPDPARWMTTRLVSRCEGWAPG